MLLNSILLFIIDYTLDCVAFVVEVKVKVVLCFKELKDSIVPVFIESQNCSVIQVEILSINS